MSRRKLIANEVAKQLLVMAETMRDPEPAAGNEAMKPTKGELRIAIKALGFSWATRNLSDTDEQAIVDGFNGREHTKGQRDYWRLGRELAGLDKP